MIPRKKQFSPRRCGGAENKGDLPLIFADDADRNF
jgi:hypothetical protein